MLDSEEKPKVGEVQKSHDDDRLTLLTDKFKDNGWEKTLNDVIQDILREPGWLLDPKTFRQERIRDHVEILNKLRSKGIHGLDCLYEISENGEHGLAFVLRFMEVFSQKYNYPYVWRGGSIEDVENSVRGTFTFFVAEAKNFLKRSYSGPRKEPCLIGLPVKAIIDQYKKSEKIFSFIAEHGYDGIFSASFDIYIPDNVPDGTMVYFPD